MITSNTPANKPKTVKVILSMSSDLNAKIIARRRKMGLSTNQELLRLIISMYFERTE